MFTEYLNVAFQHYGVAFFRLVIFAAFVVPGIAIISIVAIVFIGKKMGMRSEIRKYVLIAIIVLSSAITWMGWYALDSLFIDHTH